MGREGLSCRCRCCCRWPGFLAGMVGRVGPAIEKRMGEDPLKMLEAAWLAGGDGGNGGERWHTNANVWEEYVTMYE